MRKSSVIIFILVLICSIATSQTGNLAKTKRCSQYNTIAKFISDTSNLKLYNDLAIGVKELKLSCYYRHFSMREFVKHSFKNYLKDTLALYETIIIEKNNLIDSLVYSNDFRDNACLNFKTNINTKPNVSVLFDRYDENIIFVKTRYMRQGESFGMTYVFWFDSFGNFIHKKMGYVE